MHPHPARPRTTHGRIQRAPSGVADVVESRDEPGSSWWLLKANGRQLWAPDANLSFINRIYRPRLRCGWRCLGQWQCNGAASNSEARPMATGNIRARGGHANRRRRRREIEVSAPGPRSPSSPHCGRWRPEHWLWPHLQLQNRLGLVSRHSTDGPRAVIHSDAGW